MAAKMESLVESDIDGLENTRKTVEETPQEKLSPNETIVQVVISLALLVDFGTLKLCLIDIGGSEEFESNLPNCNSIKDLVSLLQGEKKWREILLKVRDRIIKQVESLNNNNHPQYRSGDSEDESTSSSSSDSDVPVELLNCGSMPSRDPGPEFRVRKSKSPVHFTALAGVDSPENERKDSHQHHEFQSSLNASTEYNQLAGCVDPTQETQTQKKHAAVYRYLQSNN